jgi:acetyl esterase/lipase
MCAEPVPDFLQTLSHRDLKQARILNRLLAFLPRYETDRRWNARVLQALIDAAHAATPDLAKIRGKVSVSSVPVAGDDIKIRFNFPSAAPVGLYVHFHGGAWVLGNARLDDRLCRQVAEDLGMLVAAVDFRNARDDRLDRTIADCHSAISWLVDAMPSLAVDKMIIGGESSGAHLAAEALLHLKKLGKIEPVIAFYSVCGAFDLEGSLSLRRSDSRSLLVDGSAAFRNLLRLRSSLSGSSFQGPLKANLENLPEALFIAGELDPIRDDSFEMSCAWNNGSGNASFLLVPEGAHGFNRFPKALAGKVNRFGRSWMKDRLIRSTGIRPKRKP